MDSARISALLEPFLASPLSQMQLQQVSTYIDMLLRWNARINLTAIRNEEEIVTRHFGESFFLARHIFPDHADISGVQAKEEVNGGEAARVLDIGSGAGFPALPLKIYSSPIHLTMIESTHKKAAFLREVARALTLTNVDVIAERAETIDESQAFPRAQVVTFRAVENFDQTLKQAAALVSPKGNLALLISANQVQRLDLVSGVTWTPPIPIPRSKARVVSIGQKN